MGAGIFTLNFQHYIYIKVNRVSSNKEKYWIWLSQHTQCKIFWYWYLHNESYNFVFIEFDIFRWLLLITITKCPPRGKETTINWTWMEFFFSVQFMIFFFSGKISFVVIVQEVWSRACGRNSQKCWGHTKILEKNIKDPIYIYNSTLDVKIFLDESHHC